MTRDLERRKLRRFLLRLQWVLNHPAVRGQTMMAAVHGMPYRGPVLDRAEIHEMAGLPEELPDPEYPDAEFCAELIPGRPRVPWSVAPGMTEQRAHTVYDNPVVANVRTRGTSEQVWTWIRAQTDGETYVCNTTGRKLMTDEEAEAKWYARFEDA